MGRRGKGRGGGHGDMEGAKPGSEGRQVETATDGSTRMTVDEEVKGEKELLITISESKRQRKRRDRENSKEKETQKKCTKEEKKEDKEEEEEDGGHNLTKKIKLAEEPSRLSEIKTGSDTVLGSERRMKNKKNKTATIKNEVSESESEENKEEKESKEEIEEEEKRKIQKQDIMMDIFDVTDSKVQISDTEEVKEEINKNELNKNELKKERKNVNATKKLKKDDMEYTLECTADTSKMRQDSGTRSTNSRNSPKKNKKLNNISHRNDSQTETSSTDANSVTSKLNGETHTQTHRCTEAEDATTTTTTTTTSTTSTTNIAVQPVSNRVNSTTSTPHTPRLHQLCGNKGNKDKITNCWRSYSRNGLLLEGGRIEVMKHPFRCCYLSQLLQDEQYLEGIKTEIKGLPFKQNTNDLYKFCQSPELRHIKTPFIAGLKNLLTTEVREWLQDITGIQLSPVLDMAVSRYSHSDVLLCHDDELESRRIAYILYLVPHWTPDDGGTLDLFDTDGCGNPTMIARSLTPKDNGFAFFEVSPISFHQVSEVLARDKNRLSINGWFHGAPLPRKPKRLPPPLNSPLLTPTHLEEEAFYAWINPVYLDSGRQKEIKKSFVTQSEIQLDNFLTEEAFERLSRAFREKLLRWKCLGPANRQRYWIIPPEDVSEELKQCYQFWSCEALFLVLSQLTGLKLHPLAPLDSEDEEEEEEQEKHKASSARCSIEAQCWGPGCYTLLRDDCLEENSALDIFLLANLNPRTTRAMSRFVTYVSAEDGEELLSVQPESNSLSLVYRDSQTLKFISYITKTITTTTNTTTAASTADSPADDDSPYFHAFACTYYE